jgi:hypothetical protein
MREAYSQRMLNPFHGVVNVVQVPGADAVSRDGVHWNLYIQGDSEAVACADGSRHQVALPDVKYGSWSAAAGLHRAPVRYVNDYPVLERIGSQLLAQVKRQAERVPFPAHDCFELWLLHAVSWQPLALLASSCQAADARHIEPCVWTPGQRAKQEFSSRWGAGGNAAEALARAVQAAAGAAPVLQWFQRDGAGGGRGLKASAEPTPLAGRYLSAAMFPELLLDEDWTDSAWRGLVADYLAWQAPWLLALPSLTPATRRRLEREACRRALLLAELYQTYPEILDPQAVLSARVEARLRQANEAAGIAEEKTTTTFFVTGN